MSVKRILLAGLDQQDAPPIVPASEDRREPLHSYAFARHDSEFVVSLFGALR